MTFFFRATDDNNILIQLTPTYFIFIQAASLQLGVEDTAKKYTAGTLTDRLKVKNIFIVT